MRQFYMIRLFKEMFTQNGFSGLTVAGTYVLSLTTQQGCDSVITLHLCVLSSNTITLLDTVCQGDTYSSYGFNIETTDSFPAYLIRLLYRI